MDHCSCRRQLEAMVCFEIEASSVCVGLNFGADLASKAGDSAEASGVTGMAEALHALQSDAVR